MKSIWELEMLTGTSEMSTVSYISPQTKLTKRNLHGVECHAENNCFVPLSLLTV